MNSKESEILNLIVNSPTTKLEFCLAQLTLVNFNIKNGGSFFFFFFLFYFSFSKKKRKERKAQPISISPCTQPYLSRQKEWEGAVWETQPVPSVYVLRNGALCKSFSPASFFPRRLYLINQATHVLPCRYPQSERLEQGIHSSIIDSNRNFQFLTIVCILIRVGSWRKMKTIISKASLE